MFSYLIKGVKDREGKCEKVKEVKERNHFLSLSLSLSGRGRPSFSSFSLKAARPAWSLYSACLVIAVRFSDQRAPVQTSEGLFQTNNARAVSVHNDSWTPVKRQTCCYAAKFSDLIGYQMLKRVPTLLVDVKQQRCCLLPYAQCSA